jgi:hypothetical protein
MSVLVQEFTYANNLYIRSKIIYELTWVLEYMFNEDPDNRNILDDTNEGDESVSLSWEKEYFKRFEWLEKDEKFIENELDEITSKMRNSLFSLCNGGVAMKNEPHLKEDPSENKLYMYFISLDQDKMFLYTDFKGNDESIIEKAQEKHAFIKLYQPRKIVFTIEINDFYDVDKYVKQFMHMFGIDNTRGGSYCDILMDEESLKCIERERKITSLEYYTEQSESVV